MKKSQQSYNSTLKMGSCELKRRPLKRVSDKRKAQNALYSKLRDSLIAMAGGKSELSGLKAACWPLEIHHIDGRQNERLLNVFNCIVVKRHEHEELQAHHSFKEIEKLKALVKKIRLAQGFEEVI